ncbi:MAG: hypothetical protein P9L97_00315 [Candidatus Tenebribacter davisii]|nr:hypothetical protein [Candidatus Tenebribacter davisii]
MKPKIKILLLLVTIIALNSCDGGCMMGFLDDGDIDSPQHFTWICTINSDGTGLHYLSEGGGNLQYTADGTKIVVGLSNGFKIIDAELGTVLVDIDTLSNTSYYTLSNHDDICYASYCESTRSSDLFLLNSTDYIIENITVTDSIGENFPSYSHDYSKIVYKQVVGNVNSLNMIELVTNQITNICSVNLGYTYPQFSLDESQIIFSTYNSYNLYDINNQVNTVTYEGNREHYPASIYEDIMTFSADNHICKMNIDSSELIDLGQGHHPQFSPDGSTIAYDGLYIMNSDGTDKQKLTDEFGEYPHFSPDGSKIVFIMERYEDD